MYSSAWTVKNLCWTCSPICQPCALTCCWKFQKLKFLGKLPCDIPSILHQLPGRVSINQKGMLACCDGHVILDAFCESIVSLTLECGFTPVYPGSKLQEFDEVFHSLAVFL